LNRGTSSDAQRDENGRFPGLYRVLGLEKDAQETFTTNRLSVSFVFGKSFLKHTFRRSIWPLTPKIALPVDHTAA
jgi:hypothetical protein